MSIAPNPYATRRAVVADPGATSETELLRREHLGHEANIKAVDGLFMLGGLFASFIAIAVMFPDLAGATGKLGLLAASFMFVALGAAGVVVGWGLRMPRSWARLPGIVLAAIGLLAFPLGTLVNGHVLWPLGSSKGRTVLSVEYAVIREATPHLRYRTPLAMWMLLGLLALAIVLLAVAFAR